MKRGNLIGAIVAAVLSVFGIGAGVKSHNKRKREQERKQREQETLLETVQKNQMEMEKTQRETVRMLYVLQSELGMDPTKMNVDIDNAG